ncbi:MAG TPA: ferric reductase-like transmembrane domain-containing protein [Acidimicrobiales bacterium]
MTASLRPELWWYVARASGLVAWFLLAASVLWGVVHASRMIPARGAPRWMLDMHRFLGGLSVIFTAVHLAALVVDSYLTFGLIELLVPFASRWRPGAVAWGVVALYLLVAVELTSLVMRRLPRRWWRAVHSSAFLLFWFATIHAATAGTDARNRLVVLGVGVVIVMLVFAITYRLLVLASPVPRPVRAVGRRDGARTRSDAPPSVAGHHVDDVLERLAAHEPLEVAEEQLERPLRIPL